MKETDRNPVIRVYPQTRQRLKVMAALNGMTMQDYIEWLSTQKIPSRITIMHTILVLEIIEKALEEGDLLSWKPELSDLIIDHTRAEMQEWKDIVGECIAFLSEERRRKSVPLAGKAFADRILMRMVDERVQREKVSNRALSLYLSHIAVVSTQMREDINYWMRGRRPLSDFSTLWRNFPKEDNPKMSEILEIYEAIMHPLSAIGEHYSDVCERASIFLQELANAARSYLKRQRKEAYQQDESAIREIVDQKSVLGLEQSEPKESNEKHNH